MTMGQGLLCRAYDKGGGGVHDELAEYSPHSLVLLSLHTFQVPHTLHLSHSSVLCVYARTGGWAVALSAAHAPLQL